MSDITGPYSYPFINALNSVVSPSTVHVKNTALARFFKRYLLQEAMSVFEWRLPDYWSTTYFLYVLYIWGYIGIINTDKFGIIPQHGTVGGYNVFYMPSFMIITNPLLRPADNLEIGTDVALIKLQPDYFGLFDIVDYYGDLMALAAEAAGGNLLNSKLSWIFAADSKIQAESYKALYDKVASGEPAAFADKSLFDDDGHLRAELFNTDVGNNFIADKLLDTLHSIRCRFLTDIGIPNSNTDKKERLIVDEVNSNNFETRSKCSLWLEEIQNGIKEAKRLFPSLTDFSVDWREELKPQKMEVMSDERMA